MALGILIWFIATWLEIAWFGFWILAAIENLRVESQPLPASQEKAE